MGTDREILAMTTSMARVEANRRNAARSTGPKTAEGKAKSRLNAFQHGMAGAGDLLAPGEDGELVARRTAAFVRELGAEGASGRILAQRAALLSVRMERLAEGELVAVAAAERQGQADFDAERARAIEDLLAEATPPGADPASALAELAGCPDGLARLREVWGNLLGRLREDDPGDAGEQATRWLGRAADHPERGEAKRDLIRRVEVEIERLGALAATLGPAARALAQARHDAGLIARFDSSPAAQLARRYEAAAERGMYQAMRAIATLNRPGSTPTAAAESSASLNAALQAAAQFTGTTSSPSPSPSLSGSTPRPTMPPVPVEPLGSFRVGIDPAVGVGRTAFNPSVPLDPGSPEARRRRPDPAKLGRQAVAGRR